MIEEYNDKNRIPQVRGGQGRTSDTVEGEGWLALWVVIGVIILAAASFMFGGC